MAVVDLNPAAESSISGYTKPDYSTGDKIASIFGNDWGMENKRNEAAYINAQNFMRDTPLLQKQGYLKAGINPMIAMSNGAQFQSAPNTSHHSKDKSIIESLMGLFGVMDAVFSWLAPGKKNK